MILLLSHGFAHFHLSCENIPLAYAKPKAQISAPFVFAAQVQSTSFINRKVQASNHLLRPHNPVRVGPSQNPRRKVFS